MAEDLGEKTEEPTARKRMESRRKGQVAKSQDLSAALILAGATLLLVAFGDDIFGGVAMIMRRALDPVALGGNIDAASAGQAVALSMGRMFWIIGPVLALMGLIALIDQLSQAGLMLSVEAIKPNLNKLNPISGTAKLFSRRNLVKAVVNILKVALLGAVAIIIIRRDMAEIVALPGLTLLSAIKVIVGLVIELAAWALAIMLLLGTIDRVYQSWQQTQDLKMTKHEVKEERKSSEGDMEMKARRMRLAREIQRQRIQSDVPKADVVVTNPTHYAVALKYDSDESNAPRVVAKGIDMLAVQIRLVASAHGVPIVERPPLARALYRSVEVGEEIPIDLYEAVAEVLAYVYRLEGRMAS